MPSCPGKKIFGSSMLTRRRKRVEEERDRALEVFPTVIRHLVSSFASHFQGQLKAIVCHEKTWCPKNRAWTASEWDQQHSLVHPKYEEPSRDIYVLCHSTGTVRRFAFEEDTTCY